jgi:hypothetical protein
MALCAAGAVSAQTLWDPYPVNPVLGPGDPGEWDDGGRIIEDVVLVGGTYHLYFEGFRTQNPEVNHGRGHATSTDGVEWTMDPANPVLSHGDPGEWDACFWNPAVAVVHDGTQFHMWYGGGASCTDPSTVRGGYATSPDGSVWAKYTDPVLPVGLPGSWDDYYVLPGAAILEGGVFKLWFNGHNGSFDQIGYAESLDGITWDKHLENPVLRSGAAGPWDAWVFSPSVVLEGSVYHMLYAGYDRSGGDWMIGYAFSSDGIHWWRSTDNPVISDPGIDIVGLPVAIDGLTWHGWYNEDRIGPGIYVTSTCCAGVFGDGFETGDTSAWSTTVP